jgi:hypothetical protein
MSQKRTYYYQHRAKRLPVLDFRFHFEFILDRSVTGSRTRQRLRQSHLRGIVSGFGPDIHAGRSSWRIHFDTQFAPFAVRVLIRRHISEEILALQFAGDLSADIIPIVH